MSLMLQETWVRFGTNGIGISDHQNRYSSGVLVGNYVENEFGNQQQVRTALGLSRRNRTAAWKLFFSQLLEISLFTPACG